MKNFILSAAVLAIAGISAAQAGTINNTNALAVQDTVVKTDTTTTPQDTVKKDTTSKELAFNYQAVADQDTTTQQQAPMEQAPAAATPATSPDKKEVKLADLPDAVKTTLTADVFKEWVPEKASMVTGDGADYYSIDVKKGEEMRSIKIGADGKVVQ